jgi:hypothetical protein
MHFLKLRHIIHRNRGLLLSQFTEPFVNMCDFRFAIAVFVAPYMDTIHFNGTANELHACYKRNFDIFIFFRCEQLNSGLVYCLQQLITPFEHKHHAFLFSIKSNIRFHMFTPLRLTIILISGKFVNWLVCHIY